MKPGRAIAAAALAALLVRLFLVDFYVVIGTSMEPALRHGTVVMVWKPAYGFRLPFAGYVGRPRAPGRGDVVVTGSRRGGERVIKRVAWVGPANVSLSKDGTRLESGDGFSIPISGEDAPWFSAGIAVPEGSVFLAGDNLETSIDSRAYGCVPVEDVEGMALFVGGSE